jgi:hypothetical protein
MRAFTILLLLILVSCDAEVFVPEEEQLETTSLIHSVVCEDFTNEPNLFDHFFVSAGTPKNHTKYRSPRRIILPINPETGRRYFKRDVVGMATDGHPDLHFVWYKNRRYSAGKSHDLDSSRKPEDFTYILPIDPEGNGQPYTPEDIAGMAIDGTSNWVFTWYKNGFVSAGSPSNLGKHREPQPVTFPTNPRTNSPFKGTQIRAVAIDGRYNRTIMYFKYNYMSEGISHEPGRYADPYCVENRAAGNIEPRHYIGAGIDYTNNHMFFWFRARNSD